MPKGLFIICHKDTIQRSGMRGDYLIECPMFRSRGSENPIGVESRVIDDSFLKKLRPASPDFLLSHHLPLLNPQPLVKILSIESLSYDHNDPNTTLFTR